MFLSKFSQNDKFGYMNPFGEVRGDLRRCLMALWKASGRLLFALIELFPYLLQFPSYEAKCVQLGCFRRGLCTEICLDRVVPINHCWHQKTRDAGLPDGEDRIFCVSSFWHNTGVTDVQTDGRICRSIYSACCAVKCCYDTREWRRWLF